MKKLLALVAMIGTLATPAVAAGHSSANRVAVHNGRAQVRQPGLDSFAMTPGSHPSVNSNSPEATGGGSVGYNEMLRYY
jgi:opacity protein-like surface antigen